MRRTVIALTAFLLAAPSADAASGRCGSEKPRSKGAIVNVTVANVACSTGRLVGGEWYARQSQGRPRSGFTVRGRTWRCRIIRRATGTDPGFVARTSVRCTAGRAVVRFQMRS